MLERSGAIPLLPLYAFMALDRDNFTYIFVVPGYYATFSGS
jgi:hypothetical protein